MNKLQYFCEVVEGKIKGLDRVKLKEDIEIFDDKPITITIEKTVKKRTTPQNRYYWGVVIPHIQASLFESQGEHFNKEEVHSFLKGRFNKTPLINKETGEAITDPLTNEVAYISKTTTKLKTVEFIEYIDKCRHFASEMFDCYIPNPNEPEYYHEKA